MIEIRLEKAGKRFEKNWIFRNLNLHLNAGEHLAILGANGSGKSTLSACLGGFSSLSEGAVRHYTNMRQITPDLLYTHVSFAAPYSTLFEHLSLREHIALQGRFKPWQDGYSAETVVELTGLASHSKKPLRQFSSGMKQRVRLTLALASQSPLTLLDEPLSHLDSSGSSWYKELIQRLLQNKTVIVASNHNAQEVFFCTQTIDLSS